MCPVDPDRAKRWNPGPPPPERAKPKPRSAPTGVLAKSSAAGLSSQPSGLSAAPSGFAGGLPALRSDGPSRLPVSRGSLPDLSSDRSRSEALEALETDMYAASSKPSVRYRRSAVEHLLEPWGLKPLPLTTEKVYKLAASIKAGGYRSAASLLSQYRVDAERAGYTCAGPLARAFTDAARSCRRGLGPSTKALALPFERLADLPPSPKPWVMGGPIGSRNALVVGAWWMMRETELAGVRAALAVVSQTSPPTAEITLPASKSDVQALGATRSHGCTCSPPNFRADCPVHALWDQLLLLQQAFPELHVDGRPALQLPLFPGLRGHPATKDRMTATIVEGARLLRCPLENADRTARVSGHSLRPTGAQGLARAGLDTWSIQLIGRWGSTAVAGYIQEATVSAAAARARSAFAARGVHDLARDVGQNLGPESARVVSEASLRQALDAWWPSVQANWRASLLDEIRDLVRTSAASSASSSRSRAGSTSSDSSASSADLASEPPAAVPADALATAGRMEHVVNLASGVRHVVVCGPPSLPVSDWVTACGWRFGRHGTAGPASMDEKPCQRCQRAEGQYGGC